MTSTEVTAEVDHRVAAALTDAATGAVAITGNRWGGTDFTTATRTVRTGVEDTEVWVLVLDHTHLVEAEARFSHVDPAPIVALVTHYLR